MFHKIHVTFGLPSLDCPILASVLNCYCLFLRAQGYGFLPQHFGSKHTGLLGVVDIPAPALIGSSSLDEGLGCTVVSPAPP